MQGIGYAGIRAVLPIPLLVLALAVAGLFAVQRAGSAPFVSAGPSAQPPVAAQDEPIRGYGMALNLTAAEVEPATGSVVVALSVAHFGHAGPHELAFSFSPADDLTLIDADGNRYQLESARYVEQVKLQPGQRTELVRARFTGPVDRVKGKDLFVTVRNLPRIDGGTWSVPVR